MLTTGLLKISKPLLRSLQKAKVSPIRRSPKTTQGWNARRLMKSKTRIMMKTGRLFITNRRPKITSSRKRMCPQSKLGRPLPHSLLFRRPSISNKLF